MSDHWKALTRLLGAPDAAEPPTHSRPLTPEPRQAQDPPPESESPPAIDQPPTGAAPSEDVSSDLIQELVTPPTKTTLPGFQAGAKLNASWDELVDELGIEPADTTSDTASATAPPVAAGETSKEKELAKFPSRTKERTAQRGSARKPSGFGAGLIEPEADDRSTTDVTEPSDQTDRHRAPESSRSEPESVAKSRGTADGKQSPDERSSDERSSDKDSTSPIDDDLFSGFAGVNRRSGRRRERPIEPTVDAPAQEQSAADADRLRHRDTTSAEVQSRRTADRREATQDSGIGEEDARSERRSRRRPRRGERQLLDQAPAGAEDTASREAAADIDRDADSDGDGDVVPRRRRRRRRGRGPSEARGSELIEATDEVFAEQADQPTVTGKGRRDRDQETPKGSRRAERPDSLFDDDHEDADEVAELRRNRPRRRQNDEAGTASRGEGRTTPRRSSSDLRDESGSRSRDTSLDDYVPLKKGSAVVTWSDTIDILVSTNLANRKGDSRTRGRGRGNGDSGRRQDR